MDKKAIVRKTADYAEKCMKEAESAHDWQHTKRVWENSLRIAKKEKGDLFVVELAALLHDIADWKFHSGNTDIGPQKARKWLEKLKVEERTIQNVCEIIKEISFKGAKVKTKMKTVEGKIVQDADRLDAIGAIGIARTFNLGGHWNREIYNPDIKPEKHRTFRQYKKSKGTTINHFYEKLLLLKARMNTREGKRIAEGRHKFMQQFLKKFFEEVKGKD